MTEIKYIRTHIGIFVDNYFMHEGIELTPKNFILLNSILNKNIIPNIEYYNLSAESYNSIIINHRISSEINPKQTKDEIATHILQSIKQFKYLNKDIN